MQRHTLLPLLLASLFAASPLLAQDTRPVVIEGRVIDGRSGEGLPGASVFLAGTAQGTVTDAEGRFALRTPLRGRFDLVGTLLGYSTATESIVLVDGEPVQLQLGLAPAELRLPGLTVDDDGRAWRRNLARFERVFIGETPNASDCRILNTEVLHFEPVGEALRAWAEAPLEIENRALGYRITYVLTEFEAGPYNETMRWDGSALFAEMSPTGTRERRRLQQRRREAYQGSFRHFLRSLAQGEASAAGFAMSRSDSLRLPRFLLHDPQIVVQRGEGPGLFKLVFDGVLHIAYRREEPERLFREQTGISDWVRFQESMLTLLAPSAAFSSYGLLMRPSETMKYGYWAWEDRISNLLPYEYGTD